MKVSKEGAERVIRIVTSRTENRHAVEYIEAMQDALDEAERDIKIARGRTESCEVEIKRLRNAHIENMAIMNDRRAHETSELKNSLRFYMMSVREQVKKIDELESENARLVNEKNGRDHQHWCQVNELEIALTNKNKEITALKLNKGKQEKNCVDCFYMPCTVEEEPCKSACNEMDMWKPKPAPKSCDTCQNYKAK